MLCICGSGTSHLTPLSYILSSMAPLLFQRHIMSKKRCAWAPATGMTSRRLPTWEQVSWCCLGPVLQTPWADTTIRFAAELHPKSKAHAMGSSQAGSFGRTFLRKNSGVSSLGISFFLVLRSQFRGPGFGFRVPAAAAAAAAAAVGVVVGVNPEFEPRNRHQGIGKPSSPQCN